VKELNLFHAVPHAGLQAIDALTQGEVGKDIFKILSSKDVFPWHGGKTAFVRSPIPSGPSRLRTI